ncbi:MAG: DUF1926 domain-containing protein [Desulfobacterota bacterium]|nr:DUF1926 domain-containing protein [Thermodesulfobacteriota bacterium]
MKHISFQLCIHNHQPVGNFEHVFHKAFTSAYRPFIECLRRHPRIKATLHYSGPLLEWFDAEQPAFLDMLKELEERRQIELLGGGFYEPIFSIVREPDVVGQLELMNQYLGARFSRMPRGAWIPERVWDPVLPKLLAAAHLAYTLLDSTHFVSAGLDPEDIRGYYVTEREGKTLAVFPIDVQLRYSIPFQPPEKTIQYMKFFAGEDEHCAITYGDDGEKFGMWPGTFAWVYEQGWLERFFSLLEHHADMICMRTLSEYYAEHPPQGQIYLPTLSYEEMMEWALPADAVMRFAMLREKLTSLGLRDACRVFIRGGYWNNFLAKYPESNQIHKKMLLVSERFEKLSAAGLPVEDARRELYKGQCNCAYWHGLFGGVYLNYLRHAGYAHLITAETIMDSAEHGDTDWIDYQVTDFNKDLFDDVLVSGKNLNVYCSPRNGGSVFELDYKPCAFNIANTFTRKREAYHRTLKHNGTPASPVTMNDFFPQAVQEACRISQEELHEHLVYDWYQRTLFLDHVLDPATTLTSFSRAQYTERGDFIAAPYRLEHIAKDPRVPAVTFVLVRDGTVADGYQSHPLRITKTIAVHDAHSALTVAYCLRSGSLQAYRAWFGVELNCTLLAANDPLKYVHFAGTAYGKQTMDATVALDDIPAFDVKDAWNGFGVRVALEPAGSVWMFPVYTIARTEDRLERMYQGTTVLLHWSLPLESGAEVHRTVHLHLYRFPGEKDQVRPT